MPFYFDPAICGTGTSDKTGTQVTEPDIPGYEEQTDTNPDSPVGVYQIYGDPRTYSARRPTYDHRHKGLRQHRHTDIGRDLRTNLFLKLLRNDG